jgi:hypothetical protein
MLLGRPWLKRVKTYHDWGNYALTITTKYKTIMQVG